MGGVHAAAYAKIPAVEICAVADLRPEKAGELAAKTGGRAYPSLEALLAAEQPDIVDICTPTHLHAEMAVDCLERGLNTLCEKPIARTSEAAQRMVAAARASGAHFMVAQVIRFWKEFAYLKQVVAEGRYGALRQVFLTRIGSTPRWSWENWFLNPQRSGLAPVDLHIHDTDFLVHLLGKPEAVDSRYDETPDYRSSFMRTRYAYGAGLWVEAESGWFNSSLPFEAGYRAVFDDLVLVYQHNVLTAYRAGSPAEPVNLGENMPLADSGINISTAGPYHAEIAYFVDCVASGKPVTIAPPEESLLSLQVVEREIESARLGHSLAMD